MVGNLRIVVGEGGVIRMVSVMIARWRFMRIRRIKSSCSSNVGANKFRI